MSTTGKSMTQAEFEQLRTIIYERSGIYFEDNKKYILDSRLMRRLKELDLEGFDQYIALLSMGPFQMDEFQEMFNRITINETSFFRNEIQLDIFEKKILPTLLEKRNATKRLRIWSAASSTGEEPYTLAIMLHRTLGTRLTDWNIEILGTDISEKALTTAQEGKYPEYAFRTTPALVRNRYFRQDGAMWTIDNAIRKMVNFDVLNLKDRMGARRRGTWDIIFCRNVLIYFDDKMKADLSDTFASLIARDGYALVGHSEKLTDTSGTFTSVSSPQAFAYRAPDAVDPTGTDRFSAPRTVASAA
jgi:chemotaxis protein methyltransferase CheR